nr:major capsid protein [European badger vesivirus]
MANSQDFQNANTEEVYDDFRLEDALSSSDEDYESDFDFDDPLGPGSEFDTKLANHFGWDSCPSMDLQFFVDDDCVCDDPFNCCHMDYLDYLGDEYYITTSQPDLIGMKHTLQNSTFWEDGGWNRPVAPPFHVGYRTYVAFKPGVIMERCIERVALGWDPDLPLEIVFRAESSDAGDPSVTTEEQGTVVATGNQPSAASMTTLAVASTGSLENEWKLFFSYHTTMTWNTRDPSGKVLFSQPLSPKLNPYLKFLSQIYSAWSGSIDIRFTVSGSGVFGGKLAAIVVPPGVDPSGGITLLQFPHVMFDARQTEPVIFNIPDIRRVLWHSMENEETSTLVIIVYNELLNPYGNNAEGTDCTITVESTPGADFQFSLLKPPTQLLRAGKEPDDLIPKTSLLWEGNRLPGVITTFAINPTIGQANRHFDANRYTAGWSSPKHADILCEVKTSTNALVTPTYGDAHMLVPGVPDGWPDYGIPADYTLSHSGTTMSTYDPLQYGIVCGTMRYTGTNQGNGGITKQAVIFVGGGSSTNVQKTNIIYASNLRFALDGLTAGKYRLKPMLVIRPDVNGTPVGDDLSRVCYYDKLPTATTRSGNFPLYYVSQFMSNYGSNGIQVYNSQVLRTSAAFATDVYNIGPDSFAVYRIKDSAGKWFDVGIAADGFSYVGSFVLDFASSQAPYTASYMGIQSAANILAHNVGAGSQRTI